MVKIVVPLGVGARYSLLKINSVWLQQNTRSIGPGVFVF